MSSSVILIGAPTNWKDEFGVTRVAGPNDAENYLQKERVMGFVLFADALKANEIEPFVEKIQSHGHEWLLVTSPSRQAQAVKWLTIKVPWALVNHDETASLQSELEKFIEHLQFVTQENERQILISQQNLRLRSLNKDLEERVEKRQKSLNKAKSRLIKANQQIHILHSASMAIQKARSTAELESSITEALSLHLGIATTRIRFKSQSTPMNELPPFAFQQALSVSGALIGEWQVIRDKPIAFNEDEINILQQISETVSLGVDRLSKFEQAEVLKQQWQATFDSISEPLCLVDSQFRIVKTNLSFTALTKTDFNSLMNANCFEKFFGSELAAELSELKPPFKISKNRWVNDVPHTYEVTSQPLHFESLVGEVFLVMFRDVSHRLHMERQILESSKMAELGLIGSSIAHELNNPLGGMLSFIQLIRMDLKGTEPYTEDVRSMEEAANRCRDIVQNLLGFARRSDTSDRKLSDLREILQQSLRITELQTRSQGISVSVDQPNKPIMLNAQANQLGQAICNLVQNSAEAVLEKRRADPRSMGKIDITIKDEGEKIILSVADNGVGISPEVQAKIFNPLFSTKSASPNAGLGLTISFKIISEHHGKLEIASQPGVGTTAKVTFQRPDLHSTSQVFDSKI